MFRNFCIIICSRIYIYRRSRLWFPTQLMNNWSHDPLRRSLLSLLLVFPVRPFMTIPSAGPWPLLYLCLSSSPFYNLPVFFHTISSMSIVLVNALAPCCKPQALTIGLGQDHHTFGGYRPSWSDGGGDGVPDCCRLIFQALGFSNSSSVHQYRPPHHWHNASWSVS